MHKRQRPIATPPAGVSGTETLREKKEKKRDSKNREVYNINDNVIHNIVVDAQIVRGEEKRTKSARLTAVVSG